MILIVIVLLCLLTFLVFFYIKQIILSCLVREKFNDMDCVENMVDYERELFNFYKGAPTKGYYINCLKKIEREAGSFLKKKIFKGLPGKALVMDIDDTLVWTGTENVNGMFPGLNPMVNLAKLAKRLGYHLIVITARGPFMLDKSIENLNALGVYPDKVFTSLWYGQDQSFKAVMRKNLENNTINSVKNMSNEDLFNGKIGNIWSPYNIKVVMSVGDRWGDIDNQNNVLGVKLPEPTDMNGYFLYNGEIKVL